MCGNNKCNCYNFRYIKKKKKKPIKRLWVRPWISRRDGQGINTILLRELELEDPQSYRNYLRMDNETFRYLASKVAALIKKQKTHLRNPISVDERLSVTLRFLATGESFSSLQYSTRIPQTTIS